MSLSVDAAIAWIPAEFGGLHRLPWIDLRSTIRFQRDYEVVQSVMWDVQLVALDVDPVTWRGTAKLAFSTGATPNMENVKKGEGIELLNAYHVIAVGVILAVEQ